MAANTDAGERAAGVPQIVPFSEPFREEMIALWARCELVRPWNDPSKDIDRCLSVEASSLFLLVRERVLIGSAMAGYDGHRGAVYYLCVHPDHRGKGHAKRLMDHCETYLTGLGCPKINLFVRADNAQVRAFYEARGYAMETSASFGLRLIPD